MGSQDLLGILYCLRVHGVDLAVLSAGVSGVLVGFFDHGLVDCQLPHWDDAREAHLYLLSMKNFDWFPSGPEQSATRLFLKFTPDRWGEFQWNPANDPITMVLNSIIWMVMAVGEVNTFFLINILHLPRDHPFNATRQAFLCLTAMPAVEEWYEYTRHVRAEYTTKYTCGKEWNEYKKLYHGRKPRLGHFTWLLAVTISLETMVVVKYSGAHVKGVAPGPEIWGPWVAFTGIFGLYFVIHCYVFYVLNKGDPNKGCPIWLRILKWTSVVPLLLLCRLWAF